MARLYTTGFEIPNYRFPFTGTHGSIQGTVKRTGGYAFNISGAILTRLTAPMTIGGTPTELFVRFAWRCSHADDNTDLFMISTNVTTDCVRIYKSGGYFGIRIGSSYYGGSQVSIVSGTWYLIELRVRLHDTTGIAELLIDGRSEVLVEGDTRPSTDSHYTVATLVSNNNARDHYYDDFAMNDTAGTVDNSWCGDGRIIALRPNGDIPTPEWSRNGGTSNFSRVSEVTPDDDTTYVFTNTVGHTDLYDLDAPSLPTGAVIKRVWVEGVARKTTTDADTVRFGVKAGATEAWSDALALGTSYSYVRGPDYLVNPDDSGPWEESDLNALQAGIRAA